MEEKVNLVAEWKEQIYKSKRFTGLLAFFADYGKYSDPTPSLAGLNEETGNAIKVVGLGGRFYHNKSKNAWFKL